MTRDSETHSLKHTHIHTHTCTNIHTRARTNARPIKRDSRAGRICGREPGLVSSFPTSFPQCHAIRRSIKLCHSANPAHRSFKGKAARRQVNYTVHERWCKRMAETISVSTKVNFCWITNNMRRYSFAKWLSF